MSSEFLKRVISSIILLPIAFLTIVEGSVYFIAVILLCLFVSIYEWLKNENLNFIKIFGIIFLIFSFYTIYQIRSELIDFWPFLIIISICIATDTGGYFFGKIIKGPKLTKLSPNKTYAGMIGGYLFCIILFFIFLNSNLNLINKNYSLNFLLFTFLISSVSQIGDISISYFKRISKIKDTGNIIPGHGGLLDRIDGMIFAFPTSYLILSSHYFDFFL